MHLPDAKVGISAEGTFTYPDVSITCDAQDRTAQRFLQYPCLIAKVLSPITEAYDRGGQFTLYRRLESLETYVLISSDAKAVEVYEQMPEGHWRFTLYESGQLQLEKLGITIAIDEIYEDVTLSPAPDVFTALSQS